MGVLFEISLVRVYLLRNARLSTCCGSVTLIVELGENFKREISSMLSRKNKYRIETKKFLSNSFSERRNFEISKVEKNFEKEKEGNTKSPPDLFFRSWSNELNYRFAKPYKPSHIIF